MRTPRAQPKAGEGGVLTAVAEVEAEADVKAHRRTHVGGLEGQGVDTLDHARMIGLTARSVDSLFATA